MKTFIILSVFLGSLNMFSQSLLTPFEKNKLTSATYEECIDYYKQLDNEFSTVLLIEAGDTDIGRPLHLVIISRNEIFEPENLISSCRVIFLINNGIHPGEPDGIDASMMLARDLAVAGVPENVVILIIPVYNVDGMLNRNNFTRVNQNGPLEYGFRGNAQNRDLNRDFIKCDTRNARSFVRIFRKWKPHLFVDTHTTNGADYPYVMTYIATQKDKLNPVLSEYLVNRLIPALEKDMEDRNYTVVPYVYNFKVTPDNGITGFMETPRYSTGYTALFNCIGFVSESHMLKSHAERVYATYEFLKSLINIAETDHAEIVKNKIKADSITVHMKNYITGYELDTTSYQYINFSGYKAEYKPSKISGFDRLFYNKSSQYTKQIRYYNNYIPVSSKTKPSAYIVPQAWYNVIYLLELNGVVMDRITEDREYITETYYIESFETRNPPFEGHYLHSNVKLKAVTQTRKFYKGDYIIYMSQESNQFIMHVLEPECPDSYFNWNFFDEILQQKEYFEPYLFEDIADSLLNTRNDLRREFESRKLSDEKFRNDPYAQLKFIYDNTIREPEFMRYPVARILE